MAKGQGHAVGRDAQPELDENLERRLKELGDMAERVVKDTLDDVERAYQRGRQSAFLDAREALLAAGGTGEREAAIERAVEQLNRMIAAFVSPQPALYQLERIRDDLEGRSRNGLGL